MISFVSLHRMHIISRQDSKHRLNHLQMSSIKLCENPMNKFILRIIQLVRVLSTSMNHLTDNLQGYNRDPLEAEQLFASMITTMKGYFIPDSKQPTKVRKTYFRVAESI